MSALDHRSPAAIHPSSASLADVLERVLDKGIVIAGDITVQLLDIELLTLKLRLLIASADTAQAMGITSYVGTPNYTMVLGTLGVHLLDETAAYGVFANGGVRIAPHAIDTVVDVQGHLIYQFAPQGKRVISKQVAYLMTNVLSDNSSRTFEFGKCSALYLYSNTQLQCYQGDPGPIRPAAVKTGLSVHPAPTGWPVIRLMFGMWKCVARTASPGRVARFSIP